MHIKKTIIVSIVVIVLIIPSIIPLFKKDFFRMHDFSHVARLQQLDKAVKDGHFPPHWSKDLGWGYGMPLFNFYAPLPYYLAEAFHLTGFSFLNSIKIIFGLTSFISFFGMFLLAKKFWGNMGGILSGLAFVYSPYRAVDFYVRGALGELFAIALIPWILWGITKRKIDLLSFLLGLFLLSHTVLNLVCLPLFILFALFYWLICGCKKQDLFKIISGFILALGLSAFFIIPAFFEKKFSQVGKLIDGYSHYSHHFLYFRQFLYGQWGYGGSVDGIEDGISFHLGKVHLLLVFITIMFSLFKLKVKNFRKRSLLSLFFILFCLGLSFLTTYHAKPIWDTIPLMIFIQFPWRLNSFIIVLIAFLTGGSIFYIRKIINKKIAFVLFLASILMILKINIRYFKPETYVKASDYYYSDEESIKKSMSGIIPDYIPIWVHKEPGQISKNEYKIISGNPKIEVLSSKTTKTVLKINAEGGEKLQINRFYFPGWQVLINGEKTNFDYKESNGIISVILPAGSYLLKAVFRNTFIRIFSNAVSLISLLFIFYLIFKNKPRFK